VVRIDLAGWRLLTAVDNATLAPMFTGDGSPSGPFVGVCSMTDVYAIRDGRWLLRRGCSEAELRHRPESIILMEKLMLF
jgi:hypothetical protein